MMEVIYTHWKNRAIEDIEGEVWKFIEGCKKRYSISNFGRVKSNRVRQGINKSSILNTCPFILKQYRSGGYLRVVAYKHKMVHVLVARAFCPNSYNKPEVHHIKNVPTYNCASNLEWNTRAENVRATLDNVGIKYKVMDIVKPENSKYLMQARKEGKCYIYGITDHESNIVYIGKATNPIQRFRQHKTWARHPVFSIRFNLVWLKEILNKGVPYMILLKEVDNKDWGKWEKYYISLYRKEGNILHNVTGGGHDMSENVREIFTSANNNRKIPILQYNLDGSFVREWDSTGLAASTLKIAKQSITRILKERRRSSKQFMWRYKTSDKIPLKISPHPKLVKNQALHYSKVTADEFF